MQIIESLDCISEFDKEVILTFGTFDGVHIGHRAIIQEVVSQSRKLGLVSLVLSFDPHPMYFLSPGKCPPILTTTAKKLELLREMGVDIVILAKLDARMSKMLDTDFVVQVLVQKLRAKSIVVGYDCAFGRNRTGNSSLLQKLGIEYNFTVKVIPPKKFNGIIASSTRIRKAISQNNLKLARQLLGRPYSISGEVVKGKGIGTKIGFPTANIKAENQMLPPSGVYAIQAKLEGRIFDGILNMGLRPTFGDNQFWIEAHLFDFEGSTYGRRMEIFFIEKIRDEKAFPSVSALSEQIKHDIAVSKKILSSFQRMKNC